MVTLFKWLIVLAALAALVAFLPIGGHTILVRWQRANSPAAFCSRGWQELKAGTEKLFENEPGPRRQASDPSARAPRPSASRPAARSVQPVEHHTDADRKALDGIVAEHVK